MTNPFSFLPLGLFILLLCDLLRMLHSLLLPFAKARKELMAGGGIEINFLGLAVHFSPFRLRPHDFDSPLLLTEREGFGKTNTKKYSNTGGGSVERIGENWRFFLPFFLWAKLRTAALTDGSTASRDEQQPVWLQHHPAASPTASRLSPSS